MNAQQTRDRVIRTHVAWFQAQGLGLYIGYLVYVWDLKDLTLEWTYSSLETAIRDIKGWS